ncbi:MAG: hypothetical protein H7Y03_03760, partial [Chitinophagaceae bacterium]|nr:hypothetical protein [Chitinophagaceae bacterium]
MSEVTLNTKTATSPTPKEIIFRYIPYLPWIALSLFIFITGAYLKLRYSTPIYNVYGKLLVKDQDGYGNTDKLNALMMLPGENSNLNNEIEIIKATSMAIRVIRGLGLQQQYAQKGSIRISLAHKSDIPFKWVIDKVKDTINPLSCEIEILNSNQFKVNENPQIYNFGQVVKMPQADFRLVPNSGVVIHPNAIKYVLSWTHEQMLALSLAGSLSVEITPDASVLTLSYLTENSKIGMDIINRYMKEYQLAGLEDKRLIAQTTADFINDQLDTLQDELGGVERNLQN